MPNYTLPRSERLRSLKAIRRMFGEGRGGFVYPFRYIWIADKQEGESEGHSIEVMFSVPKKFHKRANKRNLLKRRTREAYRLNREELCERISQAGVEVNLALISATEEVNSYNTVENAVPNISAPVCERL